jgi:hypothetical protein
VVDSDVCLSAPAYLRACLLRLRQRERDLAAEVRRRERSARIESVVMQQERNAAQRRAAAREQERLERWMEQSQAAEAAQQQVEAKRQAQERLQFRSGLDAIVAEKETARRRREEEQALESRRVRSMDVIEESDWEQRHVHRDRLAMQKKLLDEQMQVMDHPL